MTQIDIVMAPDPVEQFRKLQKENRAKWAGLRYSIPSQQEASITLWIWLKNNRFTFKRDALPDGEMFTIYCLECGEELTSYEITAGTAGKIELNERRPDCWDGFLPEHKSASMAIIDEIEQELDRRGYLFHHLSE